MSIESWAENEVRLACEREAPNRKEGEWDYGCACYESALKAYKTLLEDEHSGMSFALTRSILDRLMHNKPLTPIEDTEDIWEFVAYMPYNLNVKEYQCKRMPSLFKTVDEDGHVEYHDNDYYVCQDTKGYRYSGGPARDIVREMFPITMPYYPSIKPVVIYTEDFLYDKKNGDFDTVGVFYALKPDGEKVEINRFLAYKDFRFCNIDKGEYIQRKVESENTCEVDI